MSLTHYSGKGKFFRASGKVFALNMHCFVKHLISFIITGVSLVRLWGSNDNWLDKWE